MAVEDYLNKPFYTVTKRPCWTFCQTILREMGKPIPTRPDKLERVDRPYIGAVVFFKQKDGGFHAGVIYPTTVHFVHCRAPLNQPDHPPIARMDALTDPLYRDIIEGYYVYRGGL